MEFDFPDPGSFIPYFDHYTYRQLDCRMSNETDILDRDPFTKIKDIIIPHLQEIVDKCEYDGEDIGVRITQSWCVRAKGEEYSPPHIHPNSQFSGVCYFNDSSAPLVLCRDDPWYKNSTFRVFNTMTANDYFLKTSNLHEYNPKAGKIIVFPSKMNHFIAPSNDGERYSLAFNAILTGKLLSDDTLASVVL
jgi:uncharacterized protein (TIGR02466 family)